MKRIVTLLAIICMVTMAMAQVKGHTYYAFDAQLGDNIRAEVLVEMENDGHLALGQIKYNNQEEAIRLYGRRDRTNPDTVELEEHLANGQWTGTLTLFLQNGTVKNGEWRSPNGTTLHPVMVAKTKSFPYSVHKTFFHPATADQIEGHYINYYREGKAFKNDRTLNINARSKTDAVFYVEHSGELILSGYNSQKMLSENEFFYSNYDDNRLTLSFRVFEEFVDVSVVMSRGDVPSDEARAAGFYIREVGVKESMTDLWGEIFSARARLENGVPSVIVSKKYLAKENNNFGEPDSQYTPGRHQITSVLGPVKDIVLFCVGVEGVEPLLCLLLEDHRVQVVPLMYFRNTGVLNASEPLGNLSDIQYFADYDPNAVVEEPEYYEESEGDGDMASYIYAIDSKNQSHAISIPEFHGNYMLNPRNDGAEDDAFLVLAGNWELNFSAKNLKHQYYGTYWIIDTQYDEQKEVMVYTVGFRMTSRRSTGDPNSQMESCDEWGKFQYSHDDEEWSNLIITPLEGINFVPGGKQGKFIYFEAVG